MGHFENSTHVHGGYFESFHGKNAREQFPSKNMEMTNEWTALRILKTLLGHIAKIV
jgi:hypothetical protein